LTGLRELSRVLRVYSRKGREMYSIEVDFDVYKKLTMLRETEATTYNDVLRDVLKLGAAPKKPEPTGGAAGGGDWVVKGVRFPAGTDFRATYKGKTYHARVEDGALKLGDTTYDSPSIAGVSITGSAVNGWRFWECRFPGKTAWQVIDKLRN
jgi:hypothetical protein